MSLTHTETQTKTSNKITNGTGSKDGKNSTEENLKHEIIIEPPHEMKIIWPRAITFLLLHLGALYSMYLYFFEAKILTNVYEFILAFLSGMAVTIGAHRMYSHRSFKANKYIRFFIIFFHTMAVQYSMWIWVRNHRQHHKYSDTNGDPHNSSRGFFFSHVGWILVRKHPDVIKNNRLIDLSDIKKDSIAMFQKNHYMKLILVVGIILPTSIPCLLWNETIWNSFFISVILRIVHLWNSTWLINSAAHLYGSRPYNKDISSRENTFVSMVVFGEGTHNYHHTFPWDYRGGELTSTATKLIDYCMKKGWIYEAKTVSQELVKRQTMKKGDGSHPEYKKLNPNGVPVSENY